MSDNKDKSTKVATSDLMEDIFKEKRAAIKAIRDEADLAIDSILSELGGKDKITEGRIMNDMAEAVRRERQRERERQERDAAYDSNERRHNEGRN
jgi:hypothetical protein